MKGFEPKNIGLHFVGIGGIGMSGIAQVLRNQGYVVSGSDLSESESTQSLSAMGIQIFIGHRASNIPAHVSVVVVSSAVRADNPEVLEARRRHVPVIPRAEMLGEIMRGKTGIAVAGTHGKTSTTSMLATILTEANLDPTLVIGGKVDSLGGNAKLGQGDLVVAEADESDGSFLHLPATFGIITNIDNDHLDHYGTLDAIREAFISFIGKMPFYGMAAVCGDDPGVMRCLSRFSKPFETYGLSPGNDWVLSEIQSGDGFAEFTLKRRGQDFSKVRIGVPGVHNCLNATAAIAVATRLGVEPSISIRALSRFAGVKRRFEIRFKSQQRFITLVDDYGHHPTEIRATLSAARSWQKHGRVVVVFQPHRYSRTLHCHEGFLHAFDQADLVILSDIYPAGEQPIAGVTAEHLCAEIKKSSHPKRSIVYGGSLDQTLQTAVDQIRDGDLVLCMGAGSVTRLPDQIAKKLGLA